MRGAAAEHAAAQRQEEVEDERVEPGDGVELDGRDLGDEVELGEIASEQGVNISPESLTNPD